MFVFLIPRTPINYRNPLRNELWSLCKNALLNQTSQNWKAIVIGDMTGEELNDKHFLSLDFDNYNKLEKLEKALNFIDTWTIKPEYLIRLDDDDIISRDMLSFIGQLPEKHDCYYDSYHTYIDLVYLKVSYIKNEWFPNTVIHKYEHAIKKCGMQNVEILLQNHDEYWHEYYRDKKSYGMSIDSLIYYRILSPFSITSAVSSSESTIQWKNHLAYLNGYGPWIPIYNSFYYYNQLNIISLKYFQIKPLRSKYYWIINKIKYFKNKLFGQ